MTNHGPWVRHGFFLDDFCGAIVSLYLSMMHSVSCQVYRDSRRRTLTEASYVGPTVPAGLSWALRWGPTLNFLRKVYRPRMSTRTWMLRLCLDCLAR
jgi:hypothetical protein